ncbi:hypothetical protein GGX14DRAFT_608875 [Mycena pura]|uniref:Uncharacterized protein n=1 Tax=Mycena pura TaxID=153505 RepID=A0AAD6UL31_9AGAR|nr:hypothetical protein GGX14DRAFT_608875 [Mycena pura]
MVRHSVALVKVFQILIAIPFLAIAYLILASHPQTAPLAAAISWTGTKIVQGTTSFAALGMVVALCSLARDARRWLTGVPPVSRSAAAEALAPTPAELEAGAGSAVQLDFDDLALAQLEADAAGASTSTASDTRTAFIPWPARMLILLFNCVIIALQLIISEVVSLEASPAANAGAALLFLLRGLEVLFVAGVVLLFLVWWKGVPMGSRFLAGRFSAAVAAAAPHSTAAAAPVEVLFDDETARDDVFTMESKMGEKA